MSDATLINLQAYDALAPWYLTWVTTNPHPSPRERYTHHLLSTTPKPSSSPPYILELGCGPGLPITSLLLRAGAHVLANDLSPAQIALAKTHNGNFPLATFVAGDMTKLSIPAGSLDGVVCFFTIFHLPRAEQRPMLERIHSWLKPGGGFVCNFATFDEEAIYGEMMGRGIFWSGFGMLENRGMVEGVGFVVEREEVVKSEADGGNEFQWFVARKRVGDDVGKLDGTGTRTTVL
jgi:SAM-dependent methyltransferase